MSKQTTAFPSENQSAKTRTKPVTPWNCLLGALISGGIAFPLYLLTTSIIESFADNPIPSNNPTAVSISVAVRTLFMGVSALITGVFGLVAVGLVALAIQVLVQRRQGSSSE